MLTGIETGSYGRDFENGYGLAELLCELDARGSAERIRLGSLAPELIGKSFIEKVKDLKILAPHFHLSVQSGSDRVLRGMKRRYNRTQALENIKMIRENIAGATFTTDLMVGFPGESEADFLDTVAFAKEARFIDAHVFAYSRRDGTPAAAYPDQVDEATKRERSARLIALASRMKAENLLEITEAGESLSVLFETREGKRMVGHSAEYVEVHVETEKELHGVLCRVFPASMESGVILGTLIED